MSNDAGQVVVGSNGRVLVADPNDVVSFPDDVSTLDPSIWTEVGFISDAGVQFTDSKSITDIPAWQSFYPVRKVVASKTSTIAYTMIQWNGPNVIFAFGGGSISSDAGVSVYTPPGPSELGIRSMIVEWTDGDETYRLVMPRGLVSGDVSPTVTRTDAADLPISFDAAPADTPESGDLSTQPWYIITDADGFSGS